MIRSWFTNIRSEMNRGDDLSLLVKYKKPRNAIPVLLHVCHFVGVRATVMSRSIWQSFLEADFGFDFIRVGYLFPDYKIMLYSMRSLIFRVAQRKLQDIAQQSKYMILLIREMVWRFSLRKTDFFRRDMASEFNPLLVIN
jgi:hypothetical protein